MNQFITTNTEPAVPAPEPKVESITISLTATGPLRMTNEDDG